MKTTPAARSLGTTPPGSCTARNGTSTSASPQPLRGGSVSKPTENDTSTTLSRIEKSPCGLVSRLLRTTRTATAIGS